MELIIRSADKNDSVFIRDLSIQLGYETSVQETRKWMTEISRKADNCVFVAVENGQVTGWIHAFYAIRLETAPFVEIGGLVVDLKSRKRGIGERLIKKVIEWSLFYKCDKIRVRSNIKREDAHRFYDGMGFKEIKQQRVMDKLI